MAFRLGTKSGDDDLDVLHEINVTPFIDVMLVLLIRKRSTFSVGPVHSPPFPQPSLVRRIASSRR